ncbi:glutamate-rich protein 3 [Rhineura floridana]|uniref:glutamate-rich protein 3 n=1 Tax=Rhineura floridana TaxID=261503 RepID=UPI002AC87F51|nr:glutamate-rich protein 3 [Rhineura floridana]
MNHPHPGFLANYNSLTDKHLAGFFSNTRIRRHLQRSGLISRSGQIISEKEYQLNAMRKDHQKYIRECLAQAIFHKVLDMERHHQVEIKRKHETSARRERVQRIKVERSRRAAEDTHHLFSPHPPTAPRNRFGRRKLGDRGQSDHLATYPRPSTAPGNIQHPVRLQPLYSNATAESAPKTTSSSRPKFLPPEKEHQYASGGEKGVLKPMDYSAGIYRLPIINNYVMPIPPPPKSEKNINTMKSGTLRGRRFHPTTAPNGLEQLLMRDTGKFYKPQVQSNAYVTMIYLGKTVHLSYDLLDYREEIKIYQQHCGGENLCVYRGKLLEGENFQFISKRHYGFPFSLTFYINGIQVDRLSSCCEYKHRKGTRLGGKHGHFGFVNVERSAPCYRCIISMGLDKKPSPPKKKMTDEDEERKEDSGKEEGSRNLHGSSSSGEENKDSQFASAPKQWKEFVGDAEEMEVEARKREIPRASDDYEKSQRSTTIYDEDFEADEEKSDGKVNEEGQADDQMNRMSKSPSDDEKDNLDHERENKISSLKTLRASDSERDESDGYAESDLEEENKQDQKCARSLSPSSTPYSTENDSDREARKHGSEQDNSDIHSEYESESTKTEREEGQETDVEEEENMGEVVNKANRNVPGTFHKNKTNLRGASPVSEEGELLDLVDMNVRDDREEDMLGRFESSRLGAQPRSRGPYEGDGKLVKEKIAEAIEHDQLLSSEPEPSDSSTEDEENIPAAQKKYEVPDGASLAEESRVLESQKVVEQVEQERQMVGKERALAEEELADEEGPKEAALEEELRAKNVAALTVKQAVKNKLAAELEKEGVAESDLDNVEKVVTYKEDMSSEGQAIVEVEAKQPKEIALEDVTSKEGEILGKCQLEGEEMEKWTFIGEASKGEEGDTEEAAEASNMLGTVALVREKIMEKGAREAKEDMKEVLKADQALGATFAGRNTVGQGEKHTEEPESEGSATLQETQDEAETVGNDTETMEGTFLKGGVKEEDYVRIHWEDASLMEADHMPPESKVKEIIDDEKGDVSVVSVDGCKGLREEVSSDMEEIVQEVSGTWREEFKKTSLGVNEMKKTSTEEDSALEKLEPWLGESLLGRETKEVISATEDENLKFQGARVSTEEEGSAGVKPSSKREAEGEAIPNGMVVNVKGAQEEEALVQEVDEEGGGTEEMLRSGVAILKQKLRLEKKVAIDHDPEAMALAMEGARREAKAEGEGGAEEAEEERKVTVKKGAEAEDTEVTALVTEEARRKAEAEGDVCAAEAERKVAVKREAKAGDAEAEEEGVFVDVGDERETAPGMTIVGRQRVADMREAKHLSELSAQKAALAGGGRESEASLQDEAEKMPKETTVGKTRLDLKMKKEEASDEEEGDEEGDEEESETEEPVITLADVEEALLMGIQQLITEVSRMKEEVEEKEEELEAEDSAEEIQMPSHEEDVVRTEFFAAVVEKKSWAAQSDEAEERGTGEPVERDHMEEKYGTKHRKTGQEESPVENMAGTEANPRSGQQPEREQQLKITAQMISLKSSRSSD